jgi:tRNA modification GTPase
VSRPDYNNIKIHLVNISQITENRKLKIKSLSAIIQMMSRTIVGIATSPGNSGVGIVRISGIGALQVAKKMFRANRELAPREAALGTVYGADFSDKAIAIYFAAPNSFTGDDVVEFQCHGGYFLLQKVMDTAVRNGAVVAEHGEFSRNAFLNGKLSLDQAESIIEIINAESDRQLINANGIFAGHLKDRLYAMEQSLVEVTAMIEATLDYPEHDIEHTTAKKIAPKIEAIVCDLQGLLATAEEGRLISEGVTVAVLGKPNVGKSSIFNRLLGRDRSIVTDIAGTTTDTVSASILYNGVKINFVDTAGIRKGKNQIETFGIERSKVALRDSDIAIAVFDAGETPDAYDSQVLELTRGKLCVYVVNKSDKGNKNAGLWRNFIGGEPLFVSAQSGENIDAIKRIVYDSTVKHASRGNSGGFALTNARHVAELSAAAGFLISSFDSLGKVTLDCVASDIGSALRCIGNVTGTEATEAVLDEIFSRFCLGK